MPGTVAIPAPEHGRLAPFVECVSALDMPEGWVVDWELGDSRPQNANVLVRRARERGSEWIFFLDADSMFEPDLLMRLLAHKRPMVCSLYLRRGKGFGPLAWSHREGTTAFRIALRDLPGEGLIPICAAGCSGMLVRREVFERVEAPWFEADTPEMPGSTDDFVFCAKVTAAGIPIVLDLGARLGHIFEYTVDQRAGGLACAWPEYTADGGWRRRIDVLTYAIAVVGPT